jgi:hypothetical protein
MTDETITLLYFVSVLIMWELGIVLCRQSLKYGVNDTGSKIFLFGLLWPGVVFVGLFALLCAAGSDVLTMMFKIDLVKGVKKLWKKKKK